MNLQTENGLMLDCLASHCRGAVAAAVLPQDARDHLGRMRWSHRRAAGALGCSSGHLTLVLTGQRQSAVLLARILSLGQAPEIPATSTYRRAAKQPRRSEW